MTPTKTIIRPAPVQMPLAATERTTSELFDQLIANVGEDLDAALPVILPGAPVTDVARRLLAIGHSTMLAQRRHAARQEVKAEFVTSAPTTRKPKRTFAADPRATAARQDLMAATQRKHTAQEEQREGYSR